MHALGQKGESAHSQAAAARLAGPPPVCLEGRQRPQGGLGLEGWQTPGTLEGRAAQEKSGANGQLGIQLGSGLEEWQAQRPFGGHGTHRGSGLEGMEAQGGSGLEGRTKGGSNTFEHQQRQLAPVLPRQQESDMYHVQPLHASVGTAQAGDTCNAAKVCFADALAADQHYQSDLV